MNSKSTLDHGSSPETRDARYTRRLQQRGSVWWKQMLHAQALYRWNIQRLVRGFVLDLGCGIGRNLAHLEGRGVGIDHNPDSVAVARSRGLQAFTPEEFRQSAFNLPDRFEALLMAHVAEHMTLPEATELLRMHLSFVRASGRVVLICPQEAGYRSDATHVQFMGWQELRTIAETAGLTMERLYSFPFPRGAGRVFRHNESILVARKP